MLNWYLLGETRQETSAAGTDSVGASGDDETSLSNDSSDDTDANSVADGADANKDNDKDSDCGKKERLIYL